jgi:sugar-specific transcriptional regulator TrmB
MDDVIEQLQRIGLTGYEAKAYVALVSAGVPIKGYEVAKRSGVPRSTVYETLAKLVARSAAFEVRTIDGTVEYLPLPPSALLGRARAETEDAIEKLRRSLAAVSVQRTSRYTHALADRAEAIRRSEDMCLGARDELLVLAWPEDIAPIKSALRRAHTSGVTVRVLTMGLDPDPVGHTFEHIEGPPDEVLSTLGSRMFVFVADLEQTVIAGFSEFDSWGIFTDDPAVIAVASQFVRFDMTVQLMMKRLSGQSVIAEWRADPETKLIAGRSTRTALNGGGREMLGDPGLAPATTAKGRRGRR